MDAPSRGVRRVAFFRFPYVLSPTFNPAASPPPFPPHSFPLFSHTLTAFSSLPAASFFFVLVLSHSRRDCYVKNVVDGKTLKVLLNPMGWCPRPAGGWVARPTSVAAQFDSLITEVRRKKESKRSLRFPIVYAFDKKKVSVDVFLFISFFLVFFPFPAH